MTDSKVIRKSVRTGVPKATQLMLFSLLLTLATSFGHVNSSQAQSLTDNSANTIDSTFSELSDRQALSVRHIPIGANFKDYTKLPLSPSIHSQRSFGSCAIQAYVRYLELEYRRSTNLWRRFSVDYILARALEQRSIQFLSSQDPAFTINQGGSTAEIQDYVENFGLVRDSEWKLRRNVQAYGDLGDLMIFNLNHLGANFKDQENGEKSAGNSSEQMLALVHEYTGLPPSPSQPFVKLDGAASLSPLQFKDHVYAKVPKVDEYLPRTLAEKYKLAKLIQKLIDNEHPVPMSFQWPDGFYDENNGILSLNLRPSPMGPLKPNFPRDYDLYDKKATPKHAVLIVGYELDSKGMVARFLIENSYSRADGDGGYIHMEMDYFLNFAYKIGIPRVGFKLD